MWINREVDLVRVRTPAKVNLFLEVLGRRPDGYHDLATLMVTVSLHDSLEFRPNGTGEIRLECDEPSLSTGPDNLVVRAARLLRERYRVSEGVDIGLAKRIPMAAGLAGGSSDAAATLAGLNRLWELGLDTQQLATLGAELGSDVAFFFYGPAAWCTGRGEIVEPLSLGRPLDLVLVCPRVGLSTARVFAALRRPDSPVEGSPVRQAVEGGNLEQLGKHLFNRLEEPAFELCPEVARWRERLARLDPLGVLMSGSGTTVFALARDATQALCFSRALASEREVGDQARVLVVRSCD
ncbi:MAG: 4-(cytidine 5'-diphospho)-2-C-methyl-D-erythritol kinase [Gemmataceae bacterium]